MLIKAKSKEDYRWYWNKLKDPWIEGIIDPQTWAQYPIDISNKIEYAFLHGLHSYNYNKYVIAFNKESQEGPHTQIHVDDPDRQRPVVRLCEGDLTKYSIAVVKKYHWYWNTSKDPWNSEISDDDWKPYSQEITDKIESGFEKGKKAIDIGEYLIYPDYQQHSPHLQVHKSESWKRRPVLRREVSRMKIVRQQMNEEEKIIIENPVNGPQHIDKMSLLYYSIIFQKFQIDENDPLILKFARHIVLLENNIMTMITSQYIEYLSSCHNLQKEVLTFEKLKKILQKDLKYIHGNHKSVLNSLTPQNFESDIVRIFCEGENISKILKRVVTVDAQFHSMGNHLQYITYLLCLLFVLGKKSRVGDMTTVFAYQEFSELQYYQIGKCMSKGEYFLSSRIIKSYIDQDIPMKFLESNKNKAKMKQVLLEIHIAKPSSDFHYLDFQPYVTQDEKMLLFPPNGIFQVNDILPQENFQLVLMEYKTNYFPQLISKMSTSEKKNIGIVDEIDDNHIEEFQFCLSATLGQEKLYLVDRLFNARILNLNCANISKDIMLSLALQLAHTPNLMKLSLSENQIENDGMKALASSLDYLTSLEEFDVQNNQIGEDGIKAFCSRIHYCHNMIRLNISRNAIGSEGMKELAAHIDNLPCLEFLDISFCSVGDTGLKALAVRLRYIPLIRSLNFSCNEISDDGMIALKFTYSKNLNYLHMNYNQIGYEGMQAFSQELKHLKGLRTLSLSNNCIDNEGMKHLSVGLQHVSGLVSLNLDGNTIGDEGLINFSNLAEMKHLKKLQYLNLNANNIADDGIQYLSYAMTYLSSLQNLNLSANQIGNKGIAVFSSQLECASSLEELDLSVNQIDDEGLNIFSAQLSNLQNLKILKLHYNQIGEEMKDIFRNNHKIIKEILI